MVEYWAVLGLCVTDCDFRRKLQSDAEATVKEYGFRLSRYELGEVKRLMVIPEVIEGLTKAHVHSWVSERGCWTGATPTDEYVHPHLRFDHEIGAFVEIPPELERLEAHKHVC